MIAQVITSFEVNKPAQVYARARRGATNSVLHLSFAWSLLLCSIASRSQQSHPPQISFELHGIAPEITIIAPSRCGEIPRSSCGTRPSVADFRLRLDQPNQTGAIVMPVREWALGRRAPVSPALKSVLRSHARLGGNRPPVDFRTRLFLPQHAKRTIVTWRRRGI